MFHQNQIQRPLHTQTSRGEQRRMDTSATVQMTRNMIVLKKNDTLYRLTVLLIRHRQE